jgi:hypothetical protein
LTLDGQYQTLDVPMLDLGHVDEQRLIQEYNVVCTKGDARCD